MDIFCVKCKCMFKCKQNGILVKKENLYYYADIYECPKCNVQLIKGIAKRSVEFTEDLKNIPIYQID